jgi:hypothetical protein
LAELSALRRGSQSNVAAVGGLNIIGPGQIIGGRAVLTLPSAENFFHTLSIGLDYKSFGETVSLGATSGSSSASSGSGSSSTVFSSPVTYYPIVATDSAQYHGDKLSAQLTAAITNNLRPMSSDFVAFDNRRTGASPNFTHANLDVSATQELPTGAQLYGRIQGQAASGPLVSSEQFSVGGFDTVRGYLEAETLGDNAAAGTFEIRSPNIGDWLPKLGAPQPASEEASTSASGGQSAPPATPGSAPVPLFNEWRLFTFLDAGVATVLMPSPEQQAQFELWSYGVGTTFKMVDHINGAIDVARPMSTQAFTQAHSTRVDFRIWGEF